MSNIRIREGLSEEDRTFPAAQIQVDDALRKMNEGTVSEDRIIDYHNIIYTAIFGDPPTEPNLFSTEGLNYFFVVIKILISIITFLFT